MEKNKKRNNDHCCKEMQHYLEEQKVLIYYNPIFRDYFIGLKSYKNGRFPISYCPWCGKKFPVSLVDKYGEVLSDEYNIYFDVPTEKYFNICAEDFNLPDETEKIPEEFKSDAWWKKRGLS